MTLERRLDLRIQNFEEIIHYSSSERKKPRETILNFFSSALEAVDPFRIVFNNLSFDSKRKELIIDNKHFTIDNRKIWVIGAGKAVGRMTQAVEMILAGLEYQGVICVPEGMKKDLKLERVQCYESTHPLPSEVNLHNTKIVLELVKQIKEEDLVIALISGGGSALWTAPTPPITIHDLIDLNRALIHSKMSIHDINKIRKHISQIKGGRLAELISCETLVLVLSDVIGDNLESIASGPLSPDPSTFLDVKILLDQHQIWKNSIPNSIREYIEKGISSGIPDTPKNAFQQVQSYILGSNKVACTAVCSSARQQGFKAVFLTDKLEGDARWIGRLLARIYCGLAESTKEPIVVVSGGESTIEVQGKGIGGRNQEVAASLLSELVSLPSPPDIEFLSVGTDGVDGNSIYAGALIDKLTIEDFVQKNLDLSTYQQENDISKFFERINGSLLVTGPTRTNVMDLQIALLNYVPDAETRS
ncbi:MAG: DUF4147 domain-containing protein [Candidatus Heimdallarchaeota archaeon]|nr:MAG: DUF4147 domain-containing protein [Candidatus Heimdallarchaeota archaeon]